MAESRQRKAAPGWPQPVQPTKRDNGAAVKGHRHAQLCADTGVRQRDDACIWEAASARTALPRRTTWTRLRSTTRPRPSDGLHRQVPQSRDLEHEGAQRVLCARSGGAERTRMRTQPCVATRLRGHVMARPAVDARSLAPRAVAQARTPLCPNALSASSRSRSGGVAATALDRPERQGGVLRIDWFLWLHRCAGCEPGG
jgi:hypothetical protein